MDEFDAILNLEAEWEAVSGRAEHLSQTLERYTRVVKATGLKADQ